MPTPTTPAVPTVGAPAQKAHGPLVLLATSARLPRLDDDGPALLAGLARLGVAAAPAVWDDATVDWAAADLVVVRSTWDYTWRHQEFLGWARSVPRLANPADVLAWNSDKRYLRDLDAAGVATVPTRWLEPGSERPVGPLWPGAPGRDVVVKPAVSAGARDTARYRPDQGEQARSHAARLLAAGRTVMVQPYLHRIDDAGETSVLVLGGQVSHAALKSPVLARPGDGRPVPPPDDDRRWRVGPAQAGEEELALARTALAAVPGGPDRLLYARVDMAPGPDGPLLLELELTEPALFLGRSEGAADRFAAAIVAACGVTPSGR